MEDSGRDSSRQPRITRRMLIVTWLWGIASLVAIGAVLYNIFRERSGISRRHSGGPEER